MLRELKSVVASTAYEYSSKVLLYTLAAQLRSSVATVLLLLQLLITLPQQQIQACEHASHLLHDVLYIMKQTCISRIHGTQTSPEAKRLKGGLID